LRKYGVRFGAYHIYLPALLKPAPRALATQLWALKHAEPELKGIDQVPHLAAGGRTSFPADKDVSKALYRVVGYRVCGERAVRVDILERLADLIRPALTWKPGAAGMKPAGAVEGGGFTVTTSMTSLTGASGEDFASILRSLGYRMERRPKPPEPETPPATVAPVEPAQPGAEGPTATEAPPAEATPTANAPPVAEAAPPEITPEPTPAEAPPSAPTEPSSTEPVAAAEAPTPATEEAAPEAAGVSAAPAEEAFIEVWRPGRPEGARRERPRGQRRPPREPAQKSSGDAPRPAAAASAAAAPDEAAKTAERPQRPLRPARKPRSDRPPRPAREGGLFATSAPKERRDKAPDPNSPFAKLAALKEQLEANAKERR
jgi:ATP-dependent RNA helicase SUPV3L1/SUV3